MHLNPGKSGLVLGIAIAGFHLVWSLIVLSGFGQAFMDFVFWAHMVHLPYTVGPFDLTACIALLVFTFVVGYLLGAAFAFVWNKIHKS